jgi:hypothetical protein
VSASLKEMLPTRRLVPPAESKKRSPDYRQRFSHRLAGSASRSIPTCTARPSDPPRSFISGSAKVRLADLVRMAAPNQQRRAPDAGHFQERKSRLAN